MTYLLALDQGTSSSRSIVFDGRGNVVAMAQREFRQIYPQPGWVEHDPRELWTTQLETAREVLHKAGLAASALHAVGIANQRETTVVWNRCTGEPVYNAIVWQDRRTEATCADLRARGLSDAVLQKTGLRLDPYFSGTKVKWILDHVPDARMLAERGELAFGTVDSWLIWQLTGGQRHVTDFSNASRTMLFNIHSNAWDEELLEALDIPASLMPQALPSAAHFGTIQPKWLGAALEIGGVAGDQQSALFGQACFSDGMAKNTYGTGCFMLMHTGDRFQLSQNGLITTAAAQLPGRPQYALEGSVFMGGAVVQWLRDGLHAIRSSSEVQALAASVPDAGGVVLVPAFTGLGAPYWQPNSRGCITGLTRGTTIAHIARAALESIAFQSAALLHAMSRDSVAGGGVALRELRVDGGACANDLLMQIQADLLGIPVVRPAVIETTALGAAYLAGLHTGMFAGLDELTAHWRAERVFQPQWSRERAAAQMAQWEHAVRQTVAA
ncbi:MAG: glycerol kinase GlpK [Hydrogenophaga sp.]|uniref:glycerol kinase GlpK n=1 Tax=Hydrogenophaga sp. TaxID=1904254 RepID=UPI00272683B0|nr:glycerol kinase GlpK [Hydrogenophaga sp.]MDO9147762.1 glycerol kinase GlpK [Hydrogenophaga sp.]MDO9603346.1 glycerol kinase GlpK [Hydrogenophaga sp.]